MTLITKKDITVPVTVQTRTALPPDRAFQPAVDLSLVFKGWGPFPAVRGVRNQTGEWDHAGVSRNPILSDGSTATEMLTEYTPGQSFAYEVTDFTNIVLRRLVYGVRGEWTFTSDGSGTLIRWTYEFKPLRRRYWFVRYVLAPLWRHYMQAGVEAAARVAKGQLRSKVPNITPGQFAYLELLNLPETDAEASYVHVFIGGDPRWNSSLPTAAVSVTSL